MANAPSRKGWRFDHRYGMLAATLQRGEGGGAVAANTAVDSILVGTPVAAAIATDSMVFSNTVALGDMVFFTRAGTVNSTEIFRMAGSAPSVSFGGVAVVSGAAFTLSSLAGRALVTAIGHQLHIPAGSLTDSGATGTRAVMAPVFVGARTILATNTITYTDVAALRLVIPIASTGATFTRVYGVWSSGQIRADSNFQVNNTATFGTTQPTASVVFQSGTAPAGTITTGGALFSDGVNMMKIIASGTANNVET